jgi:hypothetical protein
MALVRFQPFAVEIDGSMFEQVRGGQSVSFPASLGEHRVRVRFRTAVWSDQVVVTLIEGQECTPECDTDWRGYPWLARKSLI